MLQDLYQYKLVIVIYTTRSITTSYVSDLCWFSFEQLYEPPLNLQIIGHSIWHHLDKKFGLPKVCFIRCLSPYCLSAFCLSLYCLSLYCLSLYCLSLYWWSLYWLSLYCLSHYCLSLYCFSIYCLSLYTAEWLYSSNEIASRSFKH